MLNGKVVLMEVMVLAGSGTVSLIGNTVNAGGGDDTINVFMQASPSTYNFSGNSFNGEAGTGDVLSFAGMSVAVTVDLAAGQTLFKQYAGVIEYSQWY